MTTSKTAEKAQELKERRELEAALGKMDIDTPAMVLVSGPDHDAFDFAVEKVKARIESKTRDCIVVVFGGEPDDDKNFLMEVENVPLFAPYRLLIVRQASKVFAKILSDDELRFNFKATLERPPERTWILLHQEGRAAADLVNTLGGRLIHLVTRELFPEQILESIRLSASKSGLKLTEEAVAEIRDRIPPRQGAIDSAIARLKENLVEGEKASVDFVRSVLFPTPGWNIQVLVDALFGGDSGRFHSEMIRRDPSEDFAPLLKSVLNRTDEIRRARVCFSEGMDDRSTLDRCGHGSKHPFVQKKILSRLRFETERFTPETLNRLYDVLSEIFYEFRSGINRDMQSVYFSQRMLEIFF